jgi:dienelactone hydrolase
MRYFLTFVICVLAPVTVHAQDKKKPGDEMIEKYLAAETDKLSAKFLDGAKTIDEWKQKRPRLCQEYMDMLGLWPIPEKTPLKATVTGTVEAHGVVVEKLHFQSKPGLYVTANLYRPKAQGRKSLGPKLPAIVYVCGHSDKGRDGNKTAFQDHGFWFANNGYVCIILDTLQLGEIPGVHHGTYGDPWRHLANGERKLPGMVKENRFWWHSIGFSPAAVECWNGIRAIDYLLTRDDIDPDKIGVTGISGGGAATFWIAAVDDRVRVAVPVSGMSDLEFYIKDKGINNHCDCMFLYNTYQWDWTTIAALVAPRPLLFANSDKDPIFPMDANRRIMKKLTLVYEMYAKAQGRQSLGLDEFVSPGGHDYRPDLRIAVFRFFNKHLKGDTTSKVEDSAKYTPLKGRDLRVFPEDKDVPKDALNGRIDETFIPAAKVTLPEKGKFEEWKDKLIKDLKSKSFRAHQKGYLETKHLSVHGDVSRWFETERHIEVVQFFSPGDAKGKPPGVGSFPLVVVNEKEVQVWSKHLPFTQGLSFAPRGYNSEWTTKSPPNNVERSHVLLGRTPDEGRAFDVGTWLRERFEDREKKGKSGILVGQGQAGIIAAYAALFEPSIKEVIVIDPPKSHKEGPHFLNVLRVLDIPEALGLLAPTPLTIIGGDAKAFERTAEIYRLAGAADKLKRK